MNEITIATKQIRDLMLEGLEKWQKAGELIVELVDKHDQTLGKISEDTQVPVDVLSRFEQLGRKQLMPYLLCSNFPAVNRIVKLPYSEQKRLERSPIELLVYGNNGADTLTVDAKNLTKSQVKQVFGPNGVRSLAAQRAYLEEDKEKKRMESQLSIVGSQMQKYQLGKNGLVVFNGPCELSRKELLRILEDMES